MKTNSHGPKQQQQNDVNGTQCLELSSPWALWEEPPTKEAADAQELNHMHCHGSS